MRAAYRLMRPSLALLFGYLVSCEAAESVSTPFQPSRSDDWPSVQDSERPGSFLPAPLPDPSPPWGRCLQEVPRGPLYYTNPGLRIAAYGSDRGEYFIERYGTEPQTSEASIQAIDARLASKFAALPDGISVGGLSSCSIGPGWTYPPVCLGAHVQARRTTLAMMTDMIGEFLKDEGNHCIGTLIAVSGWDAPRCEPSDPACLPFPYHRPPQPYQPDAPRKPVQQRASLTAGYCQHDGDCVANGCGNHCTSYTNDGLPGICPFYPDLSPAFCGCVQGQCWWFTQ